MSAEGAGIHRQCHTLGMSDGAGEQRDDVSPAAGEPRERAATAPQPAGTVAPHPVRIDLAAAQRLARERFGTDMALGRYFFLTGDDEDHGRLRVGISHLDEAALTQALDVDVEEWKAEIPQITEWFEKFGDDLPTVLWTELDALKARLGV